MGPDLNASARRTLVTAVTYCLLALAFVLGVVWLFRTVHEFNRRLDLTEMRTFTDSATAEELAGFQRALHSEDSYLAVTRGLLAELTAATSRV